MVRAVDKADAMLTLSSARKYRVPFFTIYLFLQVPVYRGADRPLIGLAGSSPAAYYHGIDGLGDVPDSNAPDLDLIQSEHAVLALIRLVNQYPGQ